MAHCLRHVSSVWLLADKVKFSALDLMDDICQGNYQIKLIFSFSVITSPCTPCRLIYIMNKYDYC